MRKFTITLLLLLPFLSFAAPRSIETPPKLERFIAKHIGTENFFQGKNSAAAKMEVRVIKDFTYYSFDLYKSVSMSTGIVFAPGHLLHHLHRGRKNYTLDLSFETRINPVTDLNNTIIIFTFSPVSERYGKL